jgi:hypothetical protein
MRGLLNWLLLTLVIWAIIDFPVQVIAVAVVLILFTKLGDL